MKKWHWSAAAIGLSIGGFASGHARADGDAAPADGAAPVTPIVFSRTLHSPDPDPADPAADWRGEFILWFAFAGMDGSISARGQSADVNVTFGDLVDGTDSLFGLSGRLEMGKGRWGGFMEGMFSTLGADDQTGPLGVADVDVRLDQFMLDFGVMYRLGEWPAGDPTPRSTTLDLYGGGRFNYLQLEVDPALLSSREQNESWIDPIVGAKVVLPFAERWRLAVNADIGGFGIESDFTWSATGVVGFDFPLLGAPATVYGGYRAVGWDFSEGSGADEFIFDVVSHGPLVGLSIRF